MENGCIGGHYGYSSLDDCLKQYASMDGLFSEEEIIFIWEILKDKYKNSKNKTEKHTIGDLMMRLNNIKSSNK